MHATGGANPLVQDQITLRKMLNFNNIINTVKVNTIAVHCNNLGN